ncbi:hypothetical protein BpHYR1_006272 [Brachionus plicatilis]|uniref:Uncharacterized protein n=1 Tax=Brachionus plicatilis TaxID=10195 RepID=A0A3M7RB98_BRAPC|nr:hypothetical protein BpHYR1_006272 [Brachionus plicatilis]
MPTILLRDVINVTSINLITHAMLWLRDQTIKQEIFKDKSLFEINWNLKLINRITLNSNESLSYKLTQLLSDRLFLLNTSQCKQLTSLENKIHINVIEYKSKRSILIVENLYVTY